MHRQAVRRSYPDLVLDLGEERECEHQVAPTLRALADAHLANVLAADAATSLAVMIAVRRGSLAVGTRKPFQGDDAAKRSP